MPAVVTQQFLNNLIKDTKEQLNSGIYIGLGRSETWGVGETPTTPTSDLEAGREARAACQHVKIVTGVSAAVARSDYVSNTIYPAYDDDNQTALPYVMNTNYEVFLCLQQGVDNTGAIIPSTIEPTVAQLTLSDPVVAGENVLVTSDTGGSPGYTWRYLFTLSQVAINRFLTLNYMPVTTFTVDPQDGDVQEQQYQIQQVAQEGQVLNVQVDDGGAGYTNPTLTILGNGTGATATANVIGGVIRSVEVNSNGQNYDFASIKIDDSGTPTENATLRVVLGPSIGIDADPTQTLRANSLIITTDFENTEFDTLFVENDFRQVILLQSPKAFGSSSAFTANTSKANRGLNIASVVNAILEDNVITGQTSQAQAIVDHYDSVNNVLYYHQSKQTGYGTFLRGEIVEQVGGAQITLTGTSSTSVVANSTDPGVDVFSGDLLYIDNVSPIQRDPNQTEDIKIVITF